MKATAILNFKGGVGKTTTTKALAALSARDGKRVLCIDCDAQGNLTQALGVAPEPGSTTLEVLTIGTGYYPDFVTPTQIDGVDLIPADLSLLESDMNVMTYGTLHFGGIPDLLDAIREDAADGDGYDVVLMDCPPFPSVACKSALAAADDVIVPVRMDAYSTAGMANLIRQISDMRDINPQLRIRGLLATMYSGSESEKKSLDVLRGLGLPVFDTVIRYSKPAVESTYTPEPINVYSPNCAASVDYKKLMEELGG